MALGITCIQCTPVQLELLRRAGAMPVSSRRCGMITRREAERLVKSFLDDAAPPKLPDDFVFDVEHSCGWGCRGAFIPSRYNRLLSSSFSLSFFFCSFFIPGDLWCITLHLLPLSVDAVFVCRGRSLGSRAFICSVRTCVCECQHSKTKTTGHMSHVIRVVVSVSTSRSRDGLETYFSNVSVSSRSRQSVGRSRSRSRLGLRIKRLGLVSVSDHKVSFTSLHVITKLGWWIVQDKSRLHTLFEIRRSNVKVGVSLHSFECQSSIVKL